MARFTHSKMIKLGLKVADTKIYEEDKIWSRYSNDKVDIGETLARVIRTLSKAFPLHKTLRAFSIGSSAEPQFRILESAFRGGLYLLDVDKEALDIAKERIHRQRTDLVRTIPGDYTKIFLSHENTEHFFKTKLNGEKMNLITLHHSLYYCEKDSWHVVFRNLYQKILAHKGAIHAVLMAAESKDQYTTTWLYNHFVGKFFGNRNDQNLLNLKKELKKNSIFKNARILSRTSRVHFSTEDFEKFMAVVWMILLYPEVHEYSLAQREKITEFIYKKFWRKKRPLVQEQNHLVIYRGLGFKGLV